ncbi:TPA: ribonuclease P [Candidatus Woesearchaeota archaeon]|nr:ribonuclease P [Candidatus Woesearchaeota archaeon]
MVNRRKSSSTNVIAEERIRTLFTEAEKAFSHAPALAHRYVAMARKIAMKTKTRIPPMLKRQFCKFCYKYLQPGVNARVRVRQGKVIVSCFECKKFMRIEVHKK